MRALRTMRFRLLAIGAILLFVTPPAHADVTLETSVPISLDVFIPCAAGGAGEVVALSGPLHILLTFTVDQNGGVHSKFHFQPQGISGVGLTTGDKYQATGETQETFNSTSATEFTFTNNFKIIGQGPGNNLLVHDTVHITINANGDVTSTVFLDSFECK